MAKIKADQPLVPSVLDRLLNDEPDLQRESSKSRNQILREMKQSVRRDLENLLNTRRRCASWPENLTELDRSLVSYGIPDVTGAGLGSDRSRVEFCRTIEAVIRACEPRFKSVKVRPLQNADKLDRTLRFRIDALLIADPAPEPVVFDSALEPGTGNFAVKGVS